MTDNEYMIIVHPKQSDKINTDSDRHLADLMARAIGIALKAHRYEGWSIDVVTAARLPVPTIEPQHEPVTAGQKEQP